MLKKKHLRAVCLAVGFLLLLVSFASAYRAILEQRALQNNLKFIHDHPRAIGLSLIEQIDDALIPGLTFLSILSVTAAAAGLLLIFVRRRFLKALPIILLLFMVSFIPGAAAETTGKTRWFVNLYLMQPVNSPSVSGNIYVYDNLINPLNADAFDAFWLSVTRIDSSGAWQFLQVGYFQSHNAFWIFAAYINSWNNTYIENDWEQINGTNAVGNGHITVSILQVSANEFVAYYDSSSNIGLKGIQPDMLPNPPEGGVPLLDGKFSITGNNLYQSSSESTDPVNDLMGHYSGLSFYDSTSSTTMLWSQVNSTYDAPYTILPISSHEFYTDKTPGSSGVGGGGGGGRYYLL